MIEKITKKYIERIIFASAKAAQAFPVYIFKTLSKFGRFRRNRQKVH